MGEIDEAVHTVREQARKWSDSRAALLIPLIVVGSGVLIWLVDMAFDLPDKIEPPLRRLIQYSNEWLEKPPTTGQPLPELKLALLSWILTWFLWGAIVAVLVAIIYFLRTGNARGVALTALSERDSLKAQLAGKRSDFFTDFRPNATAILKSSLMTRMAEVLQLDASYQVDEKGNLFTTVKRRIRAKDHPILMLAGGAAGLPAQVLNFNDIKLNVKCSHLKKKLIWLPVVNEPNRKDFFMLVEPELKPGEELEYEYSWIWKEAMVPLINTGIDRLVLELRSLSPVPQSTVTIELHQIIPPVVIENNGFGDGELENKAPSVNSRGYRTYKWVMKDLHPAADKEIILDFRPL